MKTVQAMLDEYLRGEESFGEVETNKAVLVKLKNPQALARAQGAVASFASALAPATIESKVYETFASQLKQSLAQKQVEADVTIVEPQGFKAATGSSHVATDVAYAIGGAGILAALWYLLSHRRK